MSKSSRRAEAARKQVAPAAEDFVHSAADRVGPLVHTAADRVGPLAQSAATRVGPLAGAAADRIGVAADKVSPLAHSAADRLGPMAESAAEASLGAEELNPSWEPPEDTRSFSARHPEVIPAVLAIAAVVLFFGAFLALRRRTGTPSDG